jgi:hypothetical protein
MNRLIDTLKATITLLIISACVALTLHTIGETESSGPAACPPLDFSSENTPSLPGPTMLSGADLALLKSEGL